MQAAQTQTADSFQFERRSVWIAVLLLVNLNFAIAGNINLGLGSLLIPLAAYLGSRYGRDALFWVAVGAFPFPVLWRADGLTFAGTSVDEYFVALIVCAWAAFPQELSSHNPLIRSKTAVYAALFLLPLAVGLSYGASSSLTLSLSWTLSALFYLLLFDLGLKSFPWRPLVLFLGAVTAANVFIVTIIGLLGGSLSEFDLSNEYRLSPGNALNSPSEFVIAVAWFSLGRLVRAIETERRMAISPLWACGAVVVLLAIGLGRTLESEIFARAFGAPLPEQFALLGGYGALWCGAVLAGLALRRLGLLLAVAITALWWLLDVVVLGFHSFFIDTGTIGTVIGFGVLGIGLRDRLLGAPSTTRSTRWVVYLLVLIAVGAEVADSPGDIAKDLLALLLAVAGALIVEAFMWARRRWLYWLPSHNGWLALLVLALLGVAGFAARSELGEALSDDDTAVEVFVLAFPVLIAFLICLASFLRNARECARDIEAIVLRLRGVPRQEAPPSPASVANSARIPASSEFRRSGPE